MVPDDETREKQEGNASRGTFVALFAGERSRPGANKSSSPMHRQGA